MPYCVFVSVICCLYVCTLAIIILCQNCPLQDEKTVELWEGATTQYELNATFKYLYGNSSKRVTDFTTHLLQFELNIRFKVCRVCMSVFLTVYQFLSELSFFCHTAMLWLHQPASQPASHFKLAFVGPHLHYAAVTELVVMMTSQWLSDVWCSEAHL